MNKNKQKKLGAFYTPDSLADEMVDNISMELLRVLYLHVSKKEK